MSRAELQVCVIAAERMRESKRAAFKAANSRHAEFKMHTVTVCLFLCSGSQMHRLFQNQAT